MFKKISKCIVIKIENNLNNNINIIYIYIIALAS